MKTLLCPRKHQYLVMASVFLLMVAFVAGTVGCDGDGGGGGGGGGGESYTLTISSTTGGSVDEPGEGTFTYDTGTLVSLVAEAEDGYWFVKWTGDVDTIDDVNASDTNITVNDHCSIIAKFVPDNFEAIWDWYDLDAIRNDLDGSYILMNDLDSTTPGYEELVSPIGTGGIGWQPIGTSAHRFIGTFDGQGYDIFNLFIHRPVTAWVGLFGCVGLGGIIENISLVDAHVTGSTAVGALIGVTESGTVSNSLATGTVTGSSHVGGLIGSMAGSNVSNSCSTGSVIGSSEYTGGLVGQSSSNIINNSYSTCTVTGSKYNGGLLGVDHGSTLTNCRSSGNVSGTSMYTGGLIGISYDGTTVTNSYSTSTVSSSAYIGGLIGTISDGTVSSCFATGTVISSSSYTGGLIGYHSESLLTNSYSTGGVTGYHSVGGLVGRQNAGTVSNCYSIGGVNGTLNSGGLVGVRDYGTVSNSFWDTETSGQATSAGGTGKTTVEMQDVVTFQNAGWHIISVAPDESNPIYLWNIVNNVTYPFLSWEP